jgi:carbonic anhydrase/acetyltransferase-like protein (isoleucine patch superfamily)
VRVSAILVINDRPSSTGLMEDCAPQERREPARGSITCAEILGQSVLDRTVTRLRNAGIRTVSVIGGPFLPSLPENRDVEIIVAGRSFERWPAAQQTLREQGAQGIETVLMIGLGAYVEVNVADTLEFHGSQGMPLTQLEDDQGPLDIWVVDSDWFRTAAAGCTLPFRYGEFPGLPIPCRMSGYVNRLAEARDLRRLVLDAFLSRCEIKPRGREVRPGIWMDDGARAHKFARLVAPVYLGRSTKVGSSAVITRFSNLEHHCQVGEGTVVDGATVLPHSALGNGLEISHAVVDGNKFVDVERNVALQIDDPNLIHDVTPRHSRVPAHREYSSQPNCGADVFEFEYSELVSRAAGGVSEVLFKG